MASKKNSKNNEPTPEEKRKNQIIQLKKTDPAVMKQDIFRLKEQLQHIFNTKNQIKAIIQRNRQENIKQTFVIEGTLKKQQGELMEIQNTYSETENKQKTEIQELKSKFLKQEDGMNLKNGKQIYQKTKEKQILQQKVSYLRSYPERKIKYQESLNELNKRLQKMQKQQQKDINNIKNTHLKERQKQDLDTQQQMNKIKSSEVSRLEQKMTTQQFIKKQNQVMQAEIALCEQQIKVLTKECQQLKKQISSNNEKAGQDALGSQASETYERSLRIIKLENKLNKLKTYLSEQTGKLQKDYEDLDHIYTKKQQETQSLITKVEGWLRIKQRDLKKVKACSQMVLNQRSNLQSYLLQVFYEHPEVDYKEERNINKVLRFLFAKINNKKPPMTYKNFLPESLKSIASSQDFRA